MKILTILLFCMLALNQLFSNNLTISNSSLQINPNAGWVYVQFDISWENSWRTSINAGNWDAAWVFVKYRVGSGDWQHGKLSPLSSEHIAPVGSTIYSTSDSVGAFIYRSADGTGNISFTTVKLAWNYAVDGIADGATIDFKVLGIEMVYVPQSSFLLGDGASSYTFRRMSSNTPLQITNIETTVKQEGSYQYAGDAILEGGITIDGLNGICTTGQGAIDNQNYPTGFKAFYCMKYEMSQGQYSAFLNLLTSTQALIRYQNTNGLYRYNITGEYPNYSTSTPELACNYLRWVDCAAYADWAGLRPMTELEYEKACRGTSTAISSEYAWGNTNIYSTDYTIINDGLSNEEISNPGINTGNAAYFSSAINNIIGPVRCGIFASSALNKTRQETGATYYGIMEMSGNLWEHVINIGSANGRGFTGLSGNGRISSNGEADVIGWPSTNADGTGFRGGSWDNNPVGLTISNRFNAIRTEYIDNNAGFRCVRNASSALLPEISISAVTGITTSSAKISGNITSHGGEAVTAHGVCWSTVTNPTIADSKTTDGAATGIFISNITGLTSGTTYYVRAYATNIVGIVYGNELTFSTILNLVSDIDGNTYEIISIDTQNWMKQNLKVKRFSNGDSITLVAGNWTGANSSAYCQVNNNESNYSAYGLLYNFYVVEDLRNVCPTGWHIPTETDWTALETNLGGTNVAGGKLKEVGLDHWISPNYNATNSSGFTALPAGYRYYTWWNYVWGPFMYFGQWGCYWENTIPYARVLYASDESLGRIFTDYKSGLSIRCLKGSVPLIKSDSATGISFNTSTLNGKVNPNGYETAVFFEYGTTTSYGQTIAATQSPVTGTSIVNVSAEPQYLKDGTTYYYRVKAVNSEGISYSKNIGFTTLTLNIGNSYQGGLVAYILQPSDPGYKVGEIRGLIAAPNDQSNTKWGCSGILLGGTSSFLWTGQINTLAIVNSCSEAGIAAKLCNDLVLNGYNDWYLPSKDELNKLYLNKAVIGNFSSLAYWSSSEYSSNWAWSQSFSTGDQSPNYEGCGKNGEPGSVRAVRTFPAFLISTSEANLIDLTTATLNGLVNSSGLITEVSFEYGSSTSYGLTVSATQSPISSTELFSVSFALSGLTPARTYHFRVKAVNSDTTIYGDDLTFVTLPSFPLVDGDSYAGGIVFYVDGTGQHGLTAASFDQTTTTTWAPSGYYDTSIGGTSPLLGTGESNTNIILSICGAGGYAAGLCFDLSLNGYSDWFLPSKNELNLMYTNLKQNGYGNFTDEAYWSSTQGTTYQFAYVQTFQNGSQGEYSKSSGGGVFTPVRVRAIRAF